MKIIIAVPDFTREAHLKKVLPGLLKKLKTQGVKEKDIEIIIATGLHSPPTKNEIRKNLGRITDKARVSCHDYGKDSVSYFGKTKDGIPVYLNKKIKNAGSIITVGVVEPHLYAGYSGGVKAVAIGLAGEKTINATHHPRFLDHPGTRICSIRQNPFRAFIEDATRPLPIKYSVNLINDKHGRLSRIFTGRPAPCFKKAARYSGRVFEKKIRRRLDAVICDIPGSKAASIYQASRAFNYIVNTKKCVLKDNALVLVRAHLEQGFGKGLGERRFMRKMLEMNTPEKTVEEVKKRGCLAGEHRAYMVAKALSRARLGFISKKAHLYKNKGLPFLFFRDTAEARRFIKCHFKKPPEIHLLKNAFNEILLRNHS